MEENRGMVPHPVGLAQQAIGGGLGRAAHMAAGLGSWAGPPGGWLPDPDLDRITMAGRPRRLMAGGADVARRRGGRGARWHRAQEGRGVADPTGSRCQGWWLVSVLAAATGSILGGISPW